MTYGYTGKIAEVNLTSGEITTTTLEEKTLQTYIGGRGLAAKILWDRLGTRWRSIDPLGPRNILLALTGPLTGYVPGMRVCVSGKSPLTNGIVGSTASGEFAMELKCAGFDGIIVTGKAEKPVYILVTDGQVEIMDAETSWGFDGKQTVKTINKEVLNLFMKRDPKYGLWKEPAMLYIGPAGENKVRNAAVMQKWAHACGYGGYGAVMGSKNLKALVAKGTGSLPDVANPEDIPHLLDKAYEGCLADKQRRFWGTGTSGYTAGPRSAEPIRNWQEEWHDEKDFGGINFETKCWIKRYWSDYGCIQSCMKIAMVKTGPLKGAITDMPDYELQAYCGTNLGIFDPEGCVYVSSIVDDLGHSGINGANTMGFAAELYQRGILTKEDFDGIEPKWGDAEAMGELAKLIAERRAIGNVLAEGTYRAAKKISKMKDVDVTQYAVTFKGMEVGAHGIRTGHHFPYIGYVISTQPGDHGSISRPPLSEARSALGDSMVFCTMSLPREDPEIVWDFLKAVTGWDMTQDEWMNINGRRIIQIQRAALLLGGPDEVWDPTVDDDNPPRWYTPLPSGPYKGAAPKREEVLEMRKQAYAEMGWDERGIPTTEELTKLGLRDVDKAMEQLRT
jgi:aldehyde:ferredoxin oxidoreductase